MGKGELDVLSSELKGVDALDILCGDGSGPDDLNGARAGAVTSGHLVVKLGDSPGELDVTVLPVHVVGSRPGIVTKPDSEGLHLSGVLLHNLVDIKDLAGGLLHLTELVHGVPKLGLGDGGVRSKDDHTVGLGVREFLSGSLTPDHLVLLHRSGNGHSSNGGGGLEGEG